MANNPYKNKIIYNGQTLIDLTGDTVVADKLIEGYTAHDAAGRPITGTAPQGSGSAISIIDTQDAAGGTIRTINAVSLAGDTVAPENLLSGYTAHNSLGQPIVGTASGGSITEITITDSGAVSQTIQPDTIYHFTSTALTSLTIIFGGSANSQYHFDFISPATAITLTLPQTVTMENDFSVEVNTKYEIDILNGYGVFAEWSVS